VNRMLLKMVMAAAVGSLLICNAAFSQAVPPRASQAIPPPAKKAAHVEIIQGPVLEIARDDLAILRWTTNNPGGTDDHFAVVHYGTNPKDLSQTAKSHIRLNRYHQDTLFRVRMDGLSPKTTYYYTVTSTESNGKGDGEESPVNHFTTPASGELVQAFQQPQPGTQQK
jgi:phosphodiesterase/alkaline phosphatase D-like protein